MEKGISLQNASISEDVSENNSVLQVISCCPSEHTENIEDNSRISLRMLILPPTSFPMHKPVRRNEPGSFFPQSQT